MYRQLPVIETENAGCADPADYDLDIDAEMAQPLRDAGTIRQGPTAGSHPLEAREAARCRCRQPTPAASLGRSTDG